VLPIGRFNFRAATSSGLNSQARRESTGLLANPVPGAQPPLDERRQVAQRYPNRVQDAHVRQMALTHQPVHGRGTHAERAATSRTVSRAPTPAPRPPSKTPSRRDPCSKGAAKTWRSRATGGMPWTSPPIPPLKKSPACDAELPRATLPDAPSAHSLLYKTSDFTKSDEMALFLTD